MTNLVRIVLIDPSHPGNIGSVARAMKNMALSDLVLVRPRSFPHAESTALAAGADDILAGARVVESVEEAVADCSFIAGTTSRPRSYYWEFTTPRDVAGRIVALAPENRAALLFGSERYGLATEDLNLCNVLVRIPANPEYCSLNLAMSVTKSLRPLLSIFSESRRDRLLTIRSPARRAARIAILSRGCILGR